MKREYQIYMIMTVVADSRERMENIVDVVRSNVHAVGRGLEESGACELPDGPASFSFEDLEEMVAGKTLTDEELLAQLAEGENNGNQG